MRNEGRIALLALTTLCGVASQLLLAQTPEKTSEPLRYQGYSEAVYEDYTLRSEYVPMSDGTLIAADIYTPVEGPPAADFPVIFQFTPYNRAFFLPRKGPVKTLAAAAAGLGFDPIFDMAELLSGYERIIRHGYILVVADMRGTGASFGTQLPLMPSLGLDGKEMIDWIAAQSWCDGNVGMMGASYLGWIQYLTTTHRPEALKCIMPEVMGFEIYTAANRPGGILAQRWLKSFDHILTRANMGIYDLRDGGFPAPPVIDEDGDGKIKDEYPVIDTAQLDSDARARYRDRSKRQEQYYYRAVQAHRQNVRVREMLDSSYQFIDSPGPSPYEDIGFAQTSPGSYLPEFRDAGIPIYFVGGWFDGFCKGTLKLFASMGTDHPSKLFMAPRFHFPTVQKPYQKYLNYEGDYMDQLTTEQIRFFDRYLKGIDNGLEEEAPVFLYVMHKGWRQAATWPLPEVETESWYFQADQGLQPSLATPGADRYQVDFGVRSNYGPKNRNRWIMTAPGTGAVMERTEIDERCQLYETNPLNKGLEVNGHPIINLWVSANQVNGDFFVYLVDVAPDGTATYVSEGQLRAGWRRLQEDDDQVMGKFDVQPELPWHGYRESQWLDSALGPQPVEIRFDLIPTAWYFRPGHRLRIAIAGADLGNFELNPVICPDSTLKSCPETWYSFHRGEVFPSRIELPIIRDDQEVARKEE